MRIYLVRHGDPDYKNDTLTPAGHKEAEALARRMQSLKPDRIYVSPLGRAKATMKYTTDLLNMPYNVEEWTREISGLELDSKLWGRICAWNIPGEEVFEHTPYPDNEIWFNRPCVKDIPIRAVYERIAAGSDDFLARHGYIRKEGRYSVAAPNEEQIVLFAHAGFGATWLAHLLNLPLALVWCGFFLPTSSVTTILFEQRSEKWASPRCIGVGDVSHLYEARLPVQHSGLLGNFY